MLREVFVGALLLAGGGYIYANRAETAEIERTVDASPSEVFRGFETFLSNGDTRVAQFARPGDWGAEALGKPVPRVTKVPDKDIDYVVERAGKQVMRIHARFRPLEGGKKTQLLLDYDIHELERVAEGQGGLAGGAVKLFLKRGMALLTDSVVARIESGGVSDSSDLFERLNARMASDPALRDVYRGQSAHAAARPMVNPDAAKVNPRGVDPDPMTRLPGEGY